MGLNTSIHHSGTLPPLGLQTGATLSGNTLRGLEPRGGLNLQGKNVPLHQNMVQTLRHKQKLAAERSSMDTRRERPVPCLPLRSDHPCSSSVVEKPSDLENQIGRMYFRSDPVKYCQRKHRMLDNSPSRGRESIQNAVISCILPVVKILLASAVFIGPVARATLTRRP